VIEEWRKAPGYPNWVEVSSLGRVRLLARCVTQGLRGGGSAQRWLPERIIPTFINIHKGGYAQVNIWIGGKNHSGKVHRMVCSAFHGEPLPLQEVNHKNGNKQDNRPENLAWVSKSENNLHSYRDLPRKKHALTKPVVAEGSGYGFIFPSMLATAKFFGGGVGSVHGWIVKNRCPDSDFQLRYL